MSPPLIVVLLLLVVVVLTEACKSGFPFVVLGFVQDFLSRRQSCSKEGHTSDLHCCQKQKQLEFQSHGLQFSRACFRIERFSSGGQAQLHAHLAQAHSL
jgi:hypothetical protein